jgi:catechol 2,3-dioxygenase-like lactoylglutathione lyase family enzyme
MLDHIGLQVRSYAVSKAFYADVVAALGYVLVEETHGWCGFGLPGKPQFWIHAGQPGGAPVQAGGRDNGPPGVREIYHPNYYGAFVLDPDGNNIEAVCHAAE